MAQAVTAGGGEKLLPKRGRKLTEKQNTTVKITQAEPNLASYSVDKTNKDCSKLGQTKQSKQLNDPRVEQQHKTGASSGTGSFSESFPKQWS